MITIRPHVGKSAFPGRDVSKNYEEACLFYKKQTTKKFVITLLVCNSDAARKEFTKAVKRTLKNKLNQKKKNSRYVTERLNLSNVQGNVELIVDRCKNKEEVRDFNQYLINQLEALLPLNTDLNILGTRP